MLRVNVKHSLIKTTFLEIRLAPEATIEEVKAKFYRMTGTPPEFQELILLKAQQTYILAPDRATLKDFNVEDYDEISITDRNPYALFGSAFNEAARNYVAPVADEERYKQLPDSVYAQIQHKLKTDPLFKQKYDESFRKRREIRLKEFQKASEMKVQDRCQISGRRRGFVRFIGEAQLKGAGIFVGIELDEPLGDCAGDQLFECKEKHGIFVNVMEAEIGDFPELDIDLEDTDEL